MERGVIRTNPAALLKAMGYNYERDNISVDKIVVDMFSNQVLVYVNGACDLYPHSIEPIPEKKAVIGL